LKLEREVVWTFIDVAFVPSFTERMNKNEGPRLHIGVGTLGHLHALHVTPASDDERSHVGHGVEAIQAATDENVDIAWAASTMAALGSGQPRLSLRTGSRWRWSSGLKPSTASCSIALMRGRAFLCLGHAFPSPGQ